MIYPKEGSVLNSNPAGVVDAPWVTTRRRTRRSDWIDYLRDDEQQARLHGRRGSAPRPARARRSTRRQFELGPPPASRRPDDRAG